MPGIHQQGLVKKRTLTEAEVTEIGQLIAVCNDYEGLYMRLGLDELRKRSGDEARDLLYYEDGSLVGYLAIDGWGKERELTGMVRPGYRRKGIFSQLFAAAKEEYQRLGVRKLILVVDQSSPAGQTFAKTPAP